MKRIAFFCILTIAVFAAQVPADQAPRVFEPVSRAHTPKEKIFDFAVWYPLLWAGYAASQPQLMKNVRWDTWGENLFEDGAVLWDGDKWYWNFVAHPYYGSEIYLYSRSRGYAPKWAFVNTAIVSAMFEFLVESTTSIPSTNDLIVTPVLGSALGWARERVGLRLVNSDVRFYRGLGHIVYLETNFGFFERVQITPVVGFDNQFTGMTVRAAF